MLRMDALATLYLFRPLGWLCSRTNRVPILMYHSISDSSKDKRYPYYQTITTPQVFAEHMDYLHRNGYSTISLAEAVSCVSGSRYRWERPVAITLDDGYQDFYTQAFPILQKYGFNTTVFLPTAYIGETARQFNKAECLTWSQIRELHTEGIEFGSHTVTHPQLKSMNMADVEYEVQASKDTIEQALGCSVKSFAYPYAFPETDRPFTRRLRGFLEESGYENGVSTIIGTADQMGDRFFMKRLPVNSCDDLRLFRAKLEGAYDWLHTVQRLSKLITIKR